jgi:Glycosyltransferase WbsX
MDTRGSPGGVRPKPKPKALAFYLPQYHPIPENDEWWGKGFTEWHNVTKARPLFPGHYQPHLPGELGYYDLRLPEVRIAQAELARAHGVHGFVYYHYWFHGRRLLERPFEEVLGSGEPDFPFALCWANEEWTRGWDAQTGHVLVRQEFSEEDDRAHIRDLLRAFKDPRYITIDGRPLMLIYRPTLVPDLRRTSEIWRREVQRAGFPGLYLCWVESWGAPPGGRGPNAFGLDASVGFMPVLREQLHPALEALRGHRVHDYQSAAESAMKHLDCAWKRFPTVMVGWDNTARRARGATIYQGATPARYEHWLRVTADSLANVRAEENYLFILAWNEWAEGNHLEPDQRYGRAFLEATRSVLLDDSPDSAPNSDLAASVATGSRSDETETVAVWHDESALNEVVANVTGLLTQLELPVGSPVVELTDRAVSSARTVAHSPSLNIVRGSFSDVPSLKAALDAFDDIRAVLLIDTLQHLAEPQELLTALAAWALEHGSPPLLITVPHIAHVDTALQVLWGCFEVRDSGPLHAANLRFFTEHALQLLLERSGWRVALRDDVHSLFSEQYDAALRDGLPEEMIGAFQVTAQAVNPNWSVSHFVWALEPYAVEMAPSSYGEAVAPDPSSEAPSIDPQAAAAIADYLASVGLVVSESDRRAVIANRSLAAWAQLPLPKRMILKFVNSSPRRAALFRRFYARLR